MKTAKIAISINWQTLKRLDQLVKEKSIPSRSSIIQDAIEEKLSRIERTRLAEECSKLDPALEKEMAEEGMLGERAEWPEY